MQALTTTQAQELGAATRLLQQGAVEQALAIARRVAMAAPQVVDAAQVLALCLTRTGDTDAAEREFRRALELAPEHPHVLANLATLLRRIGRPVEAVEAWKRAVAAAPVFAQAWIDLGLTELGLEHLPQALAALQRATALQPDSAPAWHGLGSAWRGSGDLDAAEAALRRSVALDASKAPVWINLGAVLRLLGRAAEAVECYERARALGYGGPELADALAGALLDIGKADEALVQARRLTEGHPGFAPGHHTLAHLLWEYGPALAPGEDPLQAFQAAVRAQPGNDALQLAYVRFLVESRQGDAALAHLHMLRARRDHPGLVRMEADALEQTGASAQAGERYAQLYRAGVRAPSLLNAYTRHLLKAGHWDRAAERAAEVTQMDPRNQEAWAYLGTAWRLLGDAREFWLCDYDRLIALVEVEPPQGFADMGAFLTALSAKLDTLHRAVREPVQQSLRGGSQTPGRLFGRPDPLLEATHTALQRAVESWLATVPFDAAHPFRSQNAGRVRVAGSWSVKLWSSGRHVNHIHSEGWISSAFYVALPPSVRADDAHSQAGCIQFGQPPLELGLDLPPRLVLRPEPGRLALFPSYMWHGTVPFEDVEPRLTIAFDMVPAKH